MIILRPYVPAVLMPVPVHEWRAPSLAQPKDQFGNADQTRWRLNARNWSGHIVWSGWFDDRDDADAFLFSLARFLIDGQPIPYADRLLPSPNWMPDLGEGLDYEFLTQVFLTTGAGSGNQTYSTPADWNNANNNVQTIGGGGSGGCARSAANSAIGSTSGGSGAAWNSVSNITLSGSITYNVGLGGAAVVRTTDGQTAGNVGNDTWFNGATLAGSSVGSKPGGAGKAAAGSQTATAGGVGANGVGTSSNNGGASGAASNNWESGGGGAGGPNAAGVNASAASSNLGAGSRGDGTFGGTGSAGSTSASSAAGNAGTEWDATHGSGGGSGACERSSGAGTSGAGGLYGAGSGGVYATGTATSGAAAQGIVYLNYTPTATMGFPFRNRTIRFFRKAA